MMIDCTSSMRPVRDQGQRGTCVAFATSAAHEQGRAARRGALADDLSIELLFWRCKQLDGDSQDCTTFQSARHALDDPGQCEETHWPYAPVRDLADPYDPPASASAAPMARATMVPLSTDTDVIAAVVADGRPVIAGLLIWEGFYTCSSKTLSPPTEGIDQTALHAVCLTGLDKDDGTVMVRNSWGPGWGDGGYAWVALAALGPVLLDAWVVMDDLDDDSS